MNITQLVQTRIYFEDGQVQDHQVGLPENVSPRFHPALREYLEPILKGRAEHVRVFWDFYETGTPRYLDLFVHECGALLEFPVNHRATAIYRNNVLQHEVPPPDTSELPAIHGNAVLFSKRVWL
jgi:hypothetical protein